MAERGAYLTYTTLLKPSIFEVIAQEKLSSTIHPAFRRITEFLARNNPERYGSLLRWYDEVFVSVNTLLQYYYFTYYGGSFAETFYGLHRVILHTKSEAPLNRRGILTSLIHVAWAPYIQDKIDKYMKQLQLDVLDGVYSKSINQMIHLILKAHNLVHVAWECSVLAFYILYLGDYVRTHSPSLHIIGMALRYTQDDEFSSTWDFVSDRWLSPKTFGQYILRLLEMGAFFMQFLQWWHSEKHNTDLGALPVPSPPSQVLGTSDSLKKKCPLCAQPWRLETLLPVSGFVFCYRCIVNHLQENLTCPVTGYPATSEDLVRLYK